MGRVLLIQCGLLFLASLFAVSAVAKPPITEGETDPVMLDLDPYLITALRGDAEHMKRIPPGRFGSEGSLVDLIEEPEFQKLIKKHDLKLFNGPMIGAVTPTSARIWVRTAGPASFKVTIGDSVS